MGERCTGHCCQEFYLPYSPEELADAYKAWSGSGGKPIAMAKDKPKPILVDIHLITPMVVHLGFKLQEQPCVNPTDEVLLGKPEVAGNYYRCKHFDAESKNCTIYDIRPAMCRNYPYAEKCNYGGCQWTAQKAKKLTEEELKVRTEVLQAAAAKVEKTDKKPTE